MQRLNNSLYSVGVNPNAKEWLSQTIAEDSLYTLPHSQDEIPHIKSNKNRHVAQSVNTGNLNR